MSKCLNCGEELVQSPRKRKKKYCNSTCRSNKWQKKARKKKDVKEKVVIAGSKSNNGTTKVVSQKSNIIVPKNLKQLKEMVPAGLAGLERSSWIAEARKKFSV